MEAVRRTLGQRLTGKYPDNGRALSTIWNVESMLTIENDDITVNTLYDGYKKVSIVRRSINSVGYYTVRKGFRTSVTGPSADICKKIKEKVDLINRLVNMDNALYTTVIKRHIYGACGWEIAKDSEGNIASLVPLISSNITPVVNEKTLEINYYIYRTVGGERILKPNEVLYFALDSMEVDKTGISSIATVMSPIKSKLLYERDLKESSKRHWAPIGLFCMDTSDIRGQAEKATAMNSFRDQLKPGQSVIYNKKIEAKVIDLKPDLMAIIRSIEKCDEEIIGNWGIPKTLLGREKTTTRATLDAALLALYQGPVGWEQLFMRRNLEKQWYDNIVRSMGQDPFVYRVKHQWVEAAPIDYQLLRACTYAVANGTMTKREMFRILDIEQYMLDAQIMPPKTGGGAMPGTPEGGLPSTDKTPAGPVDDEPGGSTDDTDDEEESQ
jgi:hypothetical protein